MDWWTPPMDPMPWTLGGSPGAFFFYWAIPAIAVGLFLLQQNWDEVHQLRRHRCFMGCLDPVRARELDREERALVFEAWRRAMLICFSAAAFTIAGSTMSVALVISLRV
jgi:hypothetical protein